MAHLEPTDTSAQLTDTSDIDTRRGRKVNVKQKEGLRWVTP
jgi:hypothetical protein